MVTVQRATIELWMHAGCCQARKKHKNGETLASFSFSCLLASSSDELPCFAQVRPKCPKLSQ